MSNEQTVQPTHKSPTKRDKTAGEQVFDYATYGGFTLLGNEWLSTVIMQQRHPGKLLHKPFEWTKAKIEKGLSGIKSSYIHEGVFNYILWACLGGMFLVVPVKLMEDNKGGIVRWLDNKIHGRDTDQDPKLAEAHKEMDEAPHQSWLSLGQGRIFVVIFAQIVHFMIGWPKAVSAQLADKFVAGTDKVSTFIRDNASYERCSLGFARWVGKMIDPQHKSAIAEVQKTVHGPERYNWHPQEGGRVEFTNIAASFLVLSGSLTLLFYIMSKAFAKQHEEKVARKEGHSPSIAQGQLLHDNVPALEQQPAGNSRDNTPSTRIADVEALSRVAEAPNLQQATV